MDWVAVVGSSRFSLGIVTTSVQVKGGGRYYTMIALWVV